MPPYIYHQKDWTFFQWDDALLAPTLSLIRHKQGRLLGFMQALGFDVQNEALLESLTQNVLKTSEIEGEILNLDQVRSSIATKLGIDIAGAVPSDRDVDGIVDMMLDATQNFNASLTEVRLFGWHASLFPTGRSGMYKIKTGSWRDDSKGPMQVISGEYGKPTIHFEAPPANTIAQEMNTFLAWLQNETSLDIIIKAGIAHFWFLTIHPFDDGNGRIARAIADMLLAKADQSRQRFYSMTAQIQIERKAYYTILEQSQKGTSNLTAWLNWFVQCLHRSLEATDVKLAKILIRTTFWNKHETTNFNPRQRHILIKLLDHFEGKLTTSKYAKLAKCSQDTSLRDIQDLLDKGILYKDKMGGRSTSYLLDAKNL